MNTSPIISTEHAYSTDLDHFGFYRRCLVCFLLIVTGLSFGQQTTAFTSSGSWTCPAGVTSVQVECWGGGGAGGRSYTTNGGAGGGGGGGAYARLNSFTVVPGQSYTVTVGGQRTSSTTSNMASDNNGNPSWFNSTSTVFAPGGPGGAGVSSAANGAGGTWGGTCTGCIGDLVRFGGNGVTGNGTSGSAGGAGGGAAGASANGGNGANGTGGTGNSGITGFSGTGAAGPGNDNNGSPGVSYGGGGSGAKRTTNPGTNRNGGVGAQGYVLISFTCPSIGTVSAGSNQSFTCSTTTTLSGSAVPSGMSGTWTVSPGGPTISSPNSATTNVTGLVLGTTYTFTWTISNGLCGSSSNSITVTSSFGAGCWNYCSPTFTSGVEPISNVQFNSINNTSGNTCGTGLSLDNFTAVSTSVLAGMPYTISVTGNTCGNYTNHMRVYFDWNQNGSLTDAGESYYLGTIVNTVSGTRTLDITIPPNAELGSTRMRVIKRFNTDPTDPCQAGTGFGQAEDYTVNIVAPSCFPPSNLSVQDITSNSATINWDAASPAPSIGYEYFVSSSSVAPTSGSTPTGSTAAGNTSANLILIPNSQYYVWVRSNCGTSDKSSWVGSLYFSNQCATKYWAGSGSGMTGGTSGTDFNNSANWSSTTGTKTATSTPGPCDDVVIRLTSAATITLSANSTVNSVNFTTVFNGAGAILDVQSFTLITVTDYAINMDIGSGSSSRIEQRIGNNGSLVIGGNASIGTGPVTSGFVDVRGSGLTTTTGTIVFKGNLTFGDGYGQLDNTSFIGDVYFDAQSSQNITIAPSYACGFKSNRVILGLTNTPTINLFTSNLVRSFLLLGNAPELRVNSNCTLNMNAVGIAKSTTWAVGGVINLQPGSTLRLSGSSGGQTGSNFPINFTIYTLDPTSTVEYYGGNQTVFATPTYGNLTISSTGTKTPGAGLTVTGNMLVNSTATFVGSTFTHNFRGDWTNNGTFTPNTSTAIFNGTVNQAIGGSSSNAFYNFTMNNAAGAVLSADASVSNVLTLTSGSVDIGDFNFNGLSSSLTGGSPTSYVRTNGTGEFRRNLPAGTTILFPVGRSTYNPVELVKSGSQHQFGVRVLDVVTANGQDNGPASTGANVGRMWDITPASGYTASNGAVSVSLIYANNQGYFTQGFSNAVTDRRMYHFGPVWNDISDITGTFVTGDYSIANYNFCRQPGVTNFSPFTISNLNVALPVELISFTAECQNEDVAVKWSTASEYNSHYFMLQVSEDGINWSDLEKTDAAGFSNTLVNYAYTHQNAARTKSYYRLIQFDNDGAMKIYNPIMSNCFSDEAVFMTFPNPSAEAFTVVVNNELLSGVNVLSISDASGKVIYSIPCELENGSGSFALEGLDLPAGLYYLQLNNGSHTSRVIKHSFR
jgi:hypothetical protein